MKNWPLLRNDPAAAARLRVRDALVAALIAWALPIAVGGVLMVVDALFLRSGDTATALTGVSVVLLYSPVLTWIALIPGALMLVVLLRLGWGGLGPALAVGLVIGLLAVWMFGGPGPVSRHSAGSRAARTFSSGQFDNAFSSASASSGNASKDVNVSIWPGRRVSAQRYHVCNAFRPVPKPSSAM